MEEEINKNENIDRELQQLKQYVPSMNFASNVVRSFSEEKLVQKELPSLVWVPRILLAGFIGLLLAFVLLLFQANPEMEISLNNEWATQLYIVLMSCIGLLAYLGMDRSVKWLMLKAWKE